MIGTDHSAKPNHPLNHRWPVHFQKIDMFINFTAKVKQKYRYSQILTDLFFHFSYSVFEFKPNLPSYTNEERS